MEGASGIAWKACCVAFAIGEVFTRTKSKGQNQGLTENDNSVAASATAK
jgi:hypothetical protein